MWVQTEEFLRYRANIIESANKIYEQKIDNKL